MQRECTSPSMYLRVTSTLWLWYHLSCGFLFRQARSYSACSKWPADACTARALNGAAIVTTGSLSNFPTAPFCLRGPFHPSSLRPGQCMVDSRRGVIMRAAHRQSCLPTVVSSYTSFTVCKRGRTNVAYAWLLALYARTLQTVHTGLYMCACNVKSIKAITNNSQAPAIEVQSACSVSESRAIVEAAAPCRWPGRTHCCRHQAWCTWRADLA